MNTETQYPQPDKVTGCMMGLMCGDALGAPVEFHTPEDLQQRFPNGITDMEDGWSYTHFVRKGQITDDSEMAIALLHSLVKNGGFSAEETRAQYQHWLQTGPADAKRRGDPDGDRETAGSESLHDQPDRKGGV